ncbi:hypothetical protein Pan161_08300 [Gimesia algae]|uniref:Uncharacterized protein n=2 Tax=Gimesia algae TaxID=2527971 RepID=A0A517V875_9PLAN|nr:hypothetical protein Pan161_08300 [Gimesia algae]
MPKVVSRWPAVGGMLLLLLCFSGCGSHSDDSRTDTAQVVQLRSASDSKIEFEITHSQINAVSLYIGEKKYGTYGNPNDSPAVRHNHLRTLISLEVSDKLKLEGGETGYGFILTTTSKNDKTGGSASCTSYKAITETGPLPYGRVKLRTPDNIVQTPDSIGLADLETPTGSLIPISIRLYFPPVPSAAVTAAVR